MAAAGALMWVAASILQVGQEAKEMAQWRDMEHALTPAHIAAALAMLTLGTSTTFWAQATTTNVRSLTAFFAALLVYTFIHFFLNPQRSSLITFAVALGLGVGHHISLVFIGALLAVGVLGMGLRRGLGWRDYAVAGLALLATQVVWLYLPLRNSAPSLLAHGDLTSWRGFTDHVLARGFAGDLFYFLRSSGEPQLFWDRLALAPTLLQFQFSGPVLVAMALATLIVLWRKRTRGVGLVLLAALLLHGFITLTYRAPQTVEYALPCWVIVCVLLGMGVQEIGTWRLEIGAWRLGVRSISSLLSLIAVGLPLVLLMVTGRAAVQRYPSFVQLSQDRSTRVNAEAVLRYPQQNEKVLAQWHEATPMWALQVVEGLRPDVRVTYVNPAGAEPYETTFARRAAETVTQTRTYVTSFFEREFAEQGLQTFPLSNTPAWRVGLAQELDMASANFVRTVWDDRIILVHPLGLPQHVQVGEQFTVDLWWSARGKPAQGDSLTVRILRPDGRLATNADVRLTGSEVAGLLRFKRTALAIPFDLPAGNYTLWAGAYNGGTLYKTRSGEEFVQVGAIAVSSLQSPTLLPASVVPFANQMVLVGSSAQRNGAIVKIDLQWLAAQPITKDYKISVRLRSKHGEGFYQTHDGVPALGAIPTLKWIAGSVITDRHVFNIGGYTGTLQAEVVVYDQVSRIPLIPLDERYADGVVVAVP
jgi:hypothetical protein